MKKYRIKVNDKIFEVELEEVNDATEVSSKPTQASNNNATINAPIGGKVLDVKVKVGDKIKKGDLVCLIEAMKMENEVLSNIEGTVKEIKVSKGAQVANKDVLIVVE